MGFYFRKSVNLGGLRFNFSKSGIGVSTGFKGFRLGKGPRGNYVQMGRNGLYYRKTWRDSKRNTNEHNKMQDIPENNQHNYLFRNENDTLDAYNTEEIYDSSSVELIDEIKSNYNKITLKWFSLFFIFNMYLFILAFIIFAYLDDKRKSTIIFYDIDLEAESRLQQFYNSFDEIIRCTRKWYILSENHNFDAKYNAGASSLVSRKAIVITSKVPKYIKTNVKIPCIPLGKKELYFLPDKILIIEGKKVGALAYKNLGISVTNGNFIESEIKPWDGTIVGYTYKYVNKSGGPDRRFSDNPRYPIMSYSYIKFYGDNGFNECIMLSKQGIGNILKDQIKILQSQKMLEKGTLIQENKLNDINEVISSTEKFKAEEINNVKEVITENILETYEDNEVDPLLIEAIDTVIETGEASTSFMQRKFKVGYARAARMIDQMEAKGIISRYQENSSRKVLITKEKWNELKNMNLNNLVIEKTEENAEETIDNQIKDKRKNMFYKK